MTWIIFVAGFDLLCPDGFGRITDPSGGTRGLLVFYYNLFNNTYLHIFAETKFKETDTVSKTIFYHFKIIFLFF